MNIAVIGSGIAGTASAWQLAQLGHSVTLFEQAQRCGPVDAGILLQPSGQAVLARLGLLDAVKARTNAPARYRVARSVLHIAESAQQP